MYQSVKSAAIALLCLFNFVCQALLQSNKNHKEINHGNTPLLKAFLLLVGVFLFASGAQAQGPELDFMGQGHHDASGHGYFFCEGNFVVNIHTKGTADTIYAQSSLPDGWVSYFSDGVFTIEGAVSSRSDHWAISIVAKDRKTNQSATFGLNFDGMNGELLDWNPGFKEHYICYPSGDSRPMLSSSTQFLGIGVVKGDVFCEYNYPFTTLKGLNAGALPGEYPYSIENCNGTTISGVIIYNKPEVTKIVNCNGSNSITILTQPEHKYTLYNASNSSMVGYVSNTNETPIEKTIHISSGYTSIDMEVAYPVSSAGGCVGEKIPIDLSSVKEIELDFLGTVKSNDNYTYSYCAAKAGMPIEIKIAIKEAADTIYNETSASLPSGYTGSFANGIYTISGSAPSENSRISFYVVAGVRDKNGNKICTKSFNVTVHTSGNEPSSKLTLISPSTNVEVPFCSGFIPAVTYSYVGPGLPIITGLYAYSRSGNTITVGLYDPTTPGNFPYTIADCEGNFFSGIITCKEDAAFTPQPISVSSICESPMAMSEIIMPSHISQYKLFDKDKNYIQTYYSSRIDIMDPLTEETTFHVQAIIGTCEGNLIPVTIKKVNIAADFMGLPIEDLGLKTVRYNTCEQVDIQITCMGDADTIFTLGSLPEGLTGVFADGVYTITGTLTESTNIPITVANGNPMLHPGVCMQPYNLELTFIKASGVALISGSTDQFICEDQGLVGSDGSKYYPFPNNENIAISYVSNEWPVVESNANLAWGYGGTTIYISGLKETPAPVPGVYTYSVKDCDGNVVSGTITYGRPITPEPLKTVRSCYINEIGARKDFITIPTQPGHYYRLRDSYGYDEQTIKATGTELVFENTVWDLGVEYSLWAMGPEENESCMGEKVVIGTPPNTPTNFQLDYLGKNTNGRYAFCVGETVSLNFAPAGDADTIFCNYLSYGFSETFVDGIYTLTGVMPSVNINLPLIVNKNLMGCDVAHYDIDLEIAPSSSGVALVSGNADPVICEGQASIGYGYYPFSNLSDIRISYSGERPVIESDANLASGWSGSTLVIYGLRDTPAPALGSYPYTVKGCDGTSVSGTITYGAPPAPKITVTPTCTGGNAKITFFAQMNMIYELYNKNEQYMRFVKGDDTEQSFEVGPINAETHYYIRSVVNQDSYRPGDGLDKGCHSELKQVDIKLGLATPEVTATGGCSAEVVFTVAKSEIGIDYSVYKTITDAPLKTESGNGGPLAISIPTDASVAQYYVIAKQSTCQSDPVTVTVEAKTGPAELTLTSGLANTTADNITAITPIVYTWGGSSTGLTLTGLDASAYKINISNKTLTISGKFQTGAYPYQVTTKGSCEEEKTLFGSITITGAVLTPPEVDPVTACIGDYAYFAIHNSTVGYTYYIYATATSTTPLGSVVGNGGTVYYNTYYSNVSTTIYVQAKLGFAESEKVSVTVTINPLPAKPTLNIPSVCEGGTASVSFATEIGYSYTLYSNNPWVLIGSSVAGDGTTKEIILTGVTADNAYQVSARNTVTGCTNYSTSIPLTFLNAGYPADVDIIADPVCDGDLRVLKINNSVLNVEYFVYSNNGAEQAKQSGDGGTLIFNIPATAGNYFYLTARKTVDGKTCSKSGTIYFEDKEQGKIDLTSGTAYYVQCVPGAITPIVYTYSNATGVSVTGLDASQYTINTVAKTVTISGNFVEGQYSYSISTTDACVKATVSGRVFIGSYAPSISASATNFCNETGVTLSVYENGTYTWYKNGVPISGATAKTYQATEAASYTVTVTNGSCVSPISSPRVITKNAATTISVMPSAPTIGLGEMVYLNVYGADSYVWAPATGLSKTTGASVIAQPIVTTTYTITGTTNFGCTGTGSVKVTVNPLPVPPIVNVSGALGVCEGGSTVVTASGAATYAWSPNTGLSNTTGASVTVSPSETTTYTVVGTAANGLTDTKTFTINVYAKPTISITPANPAICKGSSVKLVPTSNQVGAFSCVWSPSVGLSSTIVNEPTASPTATTTYLLTVSQNYCTATATVKVDVEDITELNITGKTIICKGESTDLSVSGAATYTWSPATNLSATTGANVTATPTSNITYTVTGYGEKACVISKTVDVKVNELPIVNITPSGSTSLVLGESVELTASGASTYEWSPAIGLSVTNAAIVVASPLVTTTYTVKGTNASNCSETKTITITVNNTPIVDVTPSAATICQTGSVQLTASGATTYTWSPTTGLSSATGETVTANPSTTTTYTVTGTTNGISGTKDVTVTVTPVAIPTLSGALTVCPNAIGSVYSTEPGMTGYVWSVMGGTISSGQSTASLVVNWGTTTGQIKVRYKNGDCEVSTTYEAVNIDVVTKPIITPGSSTSFCAGGSVVLSSSAASGYEWFKDGAFVGTANSYTATTAGSYTVQTKTALGCVSEISEPIVVTVGSVLPTILTGNTTVCSHSDGHVYTTETGKMTYAWTVSGGTITAGGNSPSVTVTWAVKGTGSITVTYGDADVECNGTSNPLSVTITEPEKPLITFDKTDICQGEYAVLRNAAPSGQRWYKDGSEMPLFFNLIQYAANEAGSYSLTVTDASGCVSPMSDPVVITVKPLPSIVVDPPAPTITSGGTGVALTASGGSSYTWTPATGLSATTGETVTANPLTTTTYTVAGVGTNGCSNTKDVTVTVFDAPVIEITASVTTICVGDEVTLTASGADTYEWSDNASSPVIAGATITVSPTFTTIYTVKGTKTGGVFGTKTITVWVNNVPTISINPPAPAIPFGGSVTMSALGASTYLWSPATNLTDPTKATVTANPAATTTYTVTGTDSKGCKANQTVIVTVGLDLPTISVSPAPAVICKGEMIPIQAFGASTYTWKAADGSTYGLSATMGDKVNVNPTVTTTYIVTGTNTNGVSNTHTFTVTVNQPPVPTISGATAAACANTEYVYTTETGMSNYSWTVLSGDVADPDMLHTESVTVTWKDAATGVLRVTYADENGCKGTSVLTAIPLENVPTPVITPSGPTSFCDGASVVLNSSAATGNEWFKDGTTLATTSSITVTTSGSYTLQTKTDLGCVSKQSEPIVVTTGALKPTILTGNTMVCSNSTGNVYTTETGKQLYSWFAVGGTITDGDGTATVTVTWNNKGTGTLKVGYRDETNSCGGASDPLVVTINEAEKPTITVDKTAFCEGDFAMLYHPAPSGHKWYKDNVLLPLKTSQYLKVTEAGSYSLIIVDGCNSPMSDAIVMTVNPAPALSVSPSTPTIGGGTGVALTASGAISYTWAPADGLSATTGAMVTANPLTTTTYTVTGTGANGCTSTKDVTVTVGDMPTITIDASSTLICETDGSVTLTASGADTYVWSPALGLSSTTGKTVTATPPYTTEYTVTGTVTSTGLFSAQKVFVKVSSPPDLVITPASPSIPPGGSVELIASGTSFYSWSPGTGLSNTNTDRVMASPSVTTTYTLTGTDNSGCSNTKDVTVTISNLPIISVTPASPAICKGGSVELTASGGASYVWSPGTGLSATTGNKVIANPTTTTTYTVIGTDGGGQQNTTQVTVKVNELPIPSITAIADQCVGAKLATIYTEGGKTNYLWEVTGASIDGANDAQNVSVTFDQVGTSTVKISYTDANGCPGSFSKDVVVKAIATPAKPIGPTVLCADAGLQTYTAEAGKLGYDWEVTSGGTITEGEGTASITVQWTNSGSVSVAYHTATECKAFSSPLSVTINAITRPSITPNGAAICAGDPLVLMSSSALTYQWYKDGTEISGATQQAYTATSGGTYTVKVDLSTGCNGVFSMGSTITENARPTVSVTPSSATILSGANVTLTASGANTYSWTPSAGLLSTNTATVIASPLTTTTYTVTGTGANGCTNTATAVVTLSGLPTISISPASATICPGGSGTTLTASGGVSYVWSPAIGLSSTTTASVIANPSATTVYTVTGTDGNGFTNTQTVTVTVSPKPSVLTAATSVCSHTTGHVYQTESGMTAYNWVITGDGTITAGQSTDKITVKWGAKGTGTVKVEYTSNSCTTWSDETSVSINQYTPSIVAESSLDICAGGSVTLTSTVGDTYQWYQNGTPINSATNRSYTASSSGVYHVEVVDNTNCVSGQSNALTVNVKTALLLSISASAANICQGESVTLTASGASSYSWTPATGLSATTGAVVTAHPTNTTTYTVTGTTDGCSGTSTTTITVDPKPVAVLTGSGAICSGNSTLLSITDPQVGDTYTWYKNGTAIANATSTYLATDAGSYTVTVKNANNCLSDLSNPIVVSTTTSAPKPSIAGETVITCKSIILSIVSSEIVTSAQWSINGIEIPGATATTYTATQAGHYTVSIHTSTGCGSPASEPHTVTMIAGNSFSDSPFTYGTAAHTLGTCIYLGGLNADQVQEEAVNSVLANSANNDDGLNAGISDATHQYGVAVDADGFVDLNDPSFRLTANGDLTIQLAAVNLSTKVANLRAWIDFNHNGVFDSGEASSLQSIPIGTSGAITTALVWTNAQNKLKNGDTYLRIRTTSEAIADNATDAIKLYADGEVEDYFLRIKTFDISKSVDKTIVDVADTVTYTLTVNNLLPASITVQVFDAIPADTRYIAGSASDGGVNQAILIDGVSVNAVNWAALTLPAHSQKSVTFKVLITNVPKADRIVHNMAFAVHQTDTINSVKDCQLTDVQIRPLHAEDDCAITFHPVPVLINVAHNDTDPERVEILETKILQQFDGTATVVNHQIQYTPPAVWIGKLDSVQYQIKVLNDSTTAWVRIAVVKPTADPFEICENTVGTIGMTPFIPTGDVVFNWYKTATGAIHHIGNSLPVGIGTNDSVFYVSANIKGQCHTAKLPVTVYSVKAPVYPDIRVQLCPLPHRTIQLSSYLDTMNFKSVVWTTPSTTLGLTAGGELSTANFVDGTYAALYKVTNYCGVGVAKMYLSPAKSATITTKRTIFVCQSTAEALHLQQILGLDIQEGAWYYGGVALETSALSGYVSKATTLPYKGALIFDGQKAYADAIGTTVGVDDQEIKLIYKTNNTNCLNNEEVEIVIRLTKNILQ